MALHPVQGREVILLHVGASCYREWNKLRPYIDGFHSDVIKLYSQNSEFLRFLIHTRLKINKK